MILAVRILGSFDHGRTRATREPPGHAPQGHGPGGSHVDFRHDAHAVLPAGHQGTKGLIVFSGARQGRRDLGGWSLRPVAQLPPHPHGTVLDMTCT